MGLFLAISGIINADKTAVEAALREFVNTRGGSIQKAPKSIEEVNTLVLLANNSNCSVLYPFSFFEWDEASRFLSEYLDVPVFSFHIHDEDLWMFVLFHKGQQAAQFNPLPEYWGDNISEAERASWSGNARDIALHVPGLTVDSISPYLRHWDLEDKKPGKAFPEDQFHFNDCWQMCDFMRKVGVKYPLDDAGAILGETYEFIVPEKMPEG